MSIIVTTQTLDSTNLQKLLRCDPSRIVAEEATPEAIETCRMVGVELLLSPGAGTRVERPIVDIGYAGEGLVHMGDIEKTAQALYEEGRKDEGLFGLVTGCIAQSDLHHEVVSGKSRDGMKDALSSFASDLHEVFRKHEMLVTVGRAEGVQLAVSRKLLDLLGQHKGTEGYLGNLHII